MTPSDSDSEFLNRARRRIHQAYSPELFGQLGNRLISTLTEHLRAVTNRETHVLNWRLPAENIAYAVKLAGKQHSSDELPDADALEETFTQLLKTMLSRGQNLHQPRYVGHQVPASVPLAGLFDAVGAVTNQVMAIYEMGPWSTAVETAMVQELGKRIGYAPGSFDGLITHGGTLANLTGLLTARNVALGDVWESGLAGYSPAPVLLAHAEAHYGIARAAGLLGLGTKQVLRVPVNKRRSMDTQKLREMLQQLSTENVPVVAVAANACATPTGAFDDLETIAKICEEFGVWLHVDAAHGGSACLSDKHRHLLKGLELADSVVWDAHKMMFVPALCAFVFYKKKKHRYEAFQQEAPYLFDPSAPGMAEYDSGMKTIECTKRAAAFGLWGLWCMFGPQLFADLVDLTFSLALEFHLFLEAAGDFETLHQPECNIVAFRYLPPELQNAAPETIGNFQRRLRRELMESGEFYLVQSESNGYGCLRVTIINPLTTEDDLQELMKSLRTRGQQILHQA